MTSELLQWLDGSPESLLLETHNCDDGLDYLSALSQKHQCDNARLAQLTVVNDINAWRSLSATQEQLVLVAPPTLGLNSEDIAEAVATGHHVLILNTRSAALVTPTKTLPRQDSCAIETELKDCGFDESKARNFAVACCGSSSVLKRLVTKHPQIAFPKWATEDHRANLAPFALLGGWKNTNPRRENRSVFESNPPIDLLCVEDFTGRPWATIEGVVSRWISNDEPMFLRFRDNIVVASRDDAWYLLGSAITPELLRRFEELASLVLDEDNPAFDLDSSKRWMANIYGKTHSLSGELRQGIVESLVLMTSYPTSGAPALDVDFKAAVRRILNSVLPEGASWKRWATFNHQIELFAEADPDFLLLRLDQDLRTDSPQIKHLFEGGDIGIFSSRMHTGLLWALEKMAWSANLLGRVTDVLARLVQIERRLPSNIGNRPSESLLTIYLWWWPHTGATIQQRIAEIRRLIRNHPDVGWSLLVQLLPQGVESHCMPTAMPRWRDWAIGCSRERAITELSSYAKQLAALILEVAGLCPRKWASILDGIFRYDDETTHIAVQRLKLIAATTEDIEGREMLWKKLSGLIHLHDRFPTARWSHPTELLGDLRNACNQLEPTDPIALNEWLFDRHPDIPGIDSVRNYAEHATELQNRRTVAIRRVSDTKGRSGILKFVDIVNRPDIVGWIAGKEEIFCIEPTELLTFLNSHNDQLRQFACSFVAGAFSSQRWQFVDTLGIRNRSPQDATTILLCLPFEQETWDWIDKNLDEELGAQYWKRCQGFIRSDDVNEARFAIRRLLKAGRPFTAVSYLHWITFEKKSDVPLAYQVLEAGLSKDQNIEEAKSLDRFAAQRLIKQLQQQSSDLSRLAKIEWAYLPILDRHTSDVLPITLTNELSRNPRLFVDLLKIVFRGEHEDPRTEQMDEPEISRYKIAQDLLEIFSTDAAIVRECTTNKQGLVDWVNEVRLLARADERIRVADSQIGQILSHYPRHEKMDAPPNEICELLDNIATSSILDGFTTGLINSRGVTWRDTRTGGQPERQLATGYRAIAERLQTEFPNVAHAFRRLADRCDFYADREDIEMERERLGR